jgi:serine/threonine protein kinase
MPATDSQDGQSHDSEPAPPVPGDRGSNLNARYANAFNAGDIIGGSYEVIAQLGEGAMGMVFKVRHVSMPAEYALKVLTTDQLNENAVIRFQNEAQAIAKLNHPNLVGIYNFGLHEGRLPFYVMDLLTGDNLLEKLDADGPMPMPLALPLFIEVCAGLGYAHRKGIVHRDVKPANFVILESPDVRGAKVKVVDFGLVKFAEEIKPDIQRLTAIGEVCGSPVYMSPEQTTAQKIDPRSDIYSLGCSLYQALTGKVPFRGRTSTETMMMQHDTPAPTLASKGDGRKYSEDLEIMVAKMLEKAPMDRYQTMETVAQDLKNVIDGKPLGTPQTQAMSASSSTGNFGSRKDLAASLQNGVRATNTGGAGLSREDSKYGDVGNDAPEANLTIVRPIALSILALALLGCIGFFVWQALQPAQTVGKKEPAATLPVAAGSVGGRTSSANYLINPVEVKSPSAMRAGQPIGLTESKYLSRTYSEGGKKYIEFDFSELGSTAFPGVIASPPMNRYPIAGKPRMVAGVPRDLVPGPDLLSFPHFIEKLRPGDISGLCLAPQYADDEVFEYFVRVPGISRLIIDNCSHLTAKIIPSLTRLKLVEFHAGGLTIDGQDLARLSFLHDLVNLSLSRCRNITPVVKKISGSKKMEQLDFAGTGLLRADFQRISTMPNLRLLNVSDNKVTVEDLRALSALSKLSVLVAVRSGLAGSSLVQELRRFPALKTIRLAPGSITERELQLLKDQYPGLTVTFANDSADGMYGWGGGSREVWGGHRRGHGGYGLFGGHGGHGGHGRHGWPGGNPMSDFESLDGAH